MRNTDGDTFSEDAEQTNTLANTAKPRVLQAEQHVPRASMLLGEEVRGPSTNLYAKVVATSSTRQAALTDIPSLCERFDATM